VTGDSGYASITDRLAVIWMAVGLVTLSPFRHGAEVLVRRVTTLGVATAVDSCDATHSEDKLSSRRCGNLAATGVVYSFATVHLHRGEPAAPFSIAEVHLDDGPLIRGMVSAATPALRVGARVAATWAVTEVDDDGNDVVEPAFVEAT
jgi:hypothetical protein